MILVVRDFTIVGTTVNEKNNAFSIYTMTDGIETTQGGERNEGLSCP